jgi:hypothetical protein
MRPLLVIIRMVPLKSGAATVVTTDVTAPLYLFAPSYLTSRLSDSSDVLVSRESCGDAIGTVFSIMVLWLKSLSASQTKHDVIPPQDIVKV